MNPSVDELVALDLLTLREHTERAGDAMDAAAQARAVAASLAVSRVLGVRRDGALVAYALLHPQPEAGDGAWFVRGFALHPAHRNGGVMRELLAAVAALAREEGVTVLRSHVYKTNAASLAFHRRLGFEPTRENDKAVEFTASAAALARAAALRPRVREAGGSS